MAVEDPGRTPASPHLLPPWERRASRGGTKAKPSGEGGPRCRGRRAVGRGAAGSRSPFCSLAGHFPRGSRGCRSGCGAAAGWGPSAAREVRAKYSPPRSSLGRGWSWSLLRGWGLALTGLGPAWVGGRRRAQCELQVPQHTATGGAPGRGVERSGVRVGIPRARGAVCSGKPATLPSMLAALPAPRYRLGKAIVNQNRSETTRPLPGTEPGKAAWLRGRAP